jgi:L-lactate dehydrogenase complex protein LldG
VVQENKKKMSSRDKILAAVRNNQPLATMAVNADAFAEQMPSEDDILLTQKFAATLKSIGGNAILVNNFDDIIQHTRQLFSDGGRIVSTFNELSNIAEVYCEGDTILSAENIELAILQAHFGVAENGAVYLTENIMCDRIVPFICQHLVAVISADSIVSNMHEAYQKIGEKEYGFAIFIAGPSKTADIEQSLVLGAHGPISMTVFVVL